MLGTTARLKSNYCGCVYFSDKTLSHVPSLNGYRSSPGLNDKLTQRPQSSPLAGVACPFGIVTLHCPLQGSFNQVPNNNKNKQQQIAKEFPNVLSSFTVLPWTQLLTIPGPLWPHCIQSLELYYNKPFSPISQRTMHTYFLENHSMYLPVFINRGASSEQGWKSPTLVSYLPQ